MLNRWRHLVGYCSSWNYLLLALFSALLQASFVGNAWSQDGSATKTAHRISARQAVAIDSAVRIEMEKQQAVGVAIGVIQEGQVAYLKGYGLADREKKLPVTEKTLFNWASVSKPLAAIAAMQLVDQKLLDLDEDIRAYVPEFPDKGAKITTRHLLTHQSGIPHYSNGVVLGTKRDYAAEQPLLDPVVGVDRFNRSPLLFQPGEKDSYSSYAYVLLSAVVQRAGKDSFTRQVRTRIAEPLDMKSLQLDFESKDQPDWSVGYVKNLAGTIVPAADDANYWKHGAGGYKSDIGDFAKFAAALLNHKLVSAEAEKQMWQPYPTSDGKATPRGLGFIVENQNGPKISHNGSQSEVATRMVIYPETKSGVVVLCNCRFVKPGEVSTAVFRALRDK